MADPFAHVDNSDDEDEEEECRVCRGPAEEGRPLFKPCKCSGSIGLTHQDCLTSWLDVTRGDGKCELCSTRFKFAPQYAPGAPDTLPPREVILRLLRRFGAKWLPFAIRVCFVISLWMVVLPLGTSYIYHSWMVKPSAVYERWEYDLMKRDVVGGAIIAIVIVVSFLSLMSFAEFLRFQWGGGGEGAGDNNAGQPRRRNDVRVATGAGGDGPIEGEIYDIILPHEKMDEDDEMEIMSSSGELDSISFSLAALREELSLQRTNNDNVGPLEMSEGLGAAARSNDNSNNLPDAWRLRHGLEPLEDSDYDPVFRNPRPDAENPSSIVSEETKHEQENQTVVQNEATPADEDDLEAFMRAQEEQDDLEQQVDMGEDEPPLPDIENRQNQRPRDDARFEPQFEPLQPAFGQDQNELDDDGMDMEINLALDELLGLRGPIIAVIRNLLWLLIFNTAYLGIFALLPSSFGVGIRTIYTKMAFGQRAISAIPGYDMVINSLVSLNEKSKETNLIFQPSDIGQIGLGYLTFACTVFFIQLVAHATLRRGANEHAGRPGEENGQKKMLTAIDCSAAIVKVVLLLFIKMLMLPLSLGFCLDVATLPLFHATIEDRIAFAGEDLFGSLFLHWVTGITFMLLVTVSVLQLREVAHPHILARVIRPQEPQPDLLGNLLQETAITHTKRIMLSLGIYAALLTLHIWLPSRLLLRNSLYEMLPFFKPKYWRIVMPQIQIPVELFLFHLCMLSVLEKYKNNIGGLQHRFLYLLGNILGFTDQILPREVEKFKRVGALPVFATLKTNEASLRDELWNNLMSEPDEMKKECIIRSRLEEIVSNEKPVYIDGETRRDGKKVLSSCAFIRFPSELSDVKRVMKTPDDTSSLLPTCIGRYRLRHAETETELSDSNCTPPKVMITPVIEIYEEMTGKLIPRPPEGWDDLGVGGAESQGRWAWGDEHLSEVEASVAARTPFFNENTNKFVSGAKFAAKMMTLLLISWAAITLLLITGLNVPLFIGHFTFHLLRVPERCFHDPLAFAIGVAFSIPVIGCVSKLANSAGPLSWVKSFRLNESRTKTIILLSFLLQWFAMCPCFLGFLYTCFFTGFSSMWESDAVGWIVNWGTGTLLLNSWAFMCYHEIFTKRFWADIAIGDPDAEGNQGAGEGRRRRGNDAARNNARQDGTSQAAAHNNGALSWQGKEGAIGRCFTAFATFFVGWEWDKLDEEAMLRDCTAPICRQLFLACFAPTFVTLIASFFYYSAIVKTARTILIGSEVHASINILFRILAISTTTIQILTSNKAGLKKWFKAAHKIARDDRYLIGEILLNYSPPSSTSIS